MTKNQIIILLILLSALAWRFVNYDHRWTLSQDQARDAIIAYHALKTGELPLLGPPSSAGEFSFGPIYYWIIILLTFLTPGVINGPWIGFTLFSTLTVVVMYYLGRVLEGHRLGLILALISSFASASVFHSVDLLNPMLIPLTTALAFLNLAIYLKRGGRIWILMVGLAISLSISFHLQALGLLTLAFLLFLFRRRGTKVTDWSVLSLGLIIPWIPVILFLTSNHFKVITNIFDYLSVGHQKFVYTNYWVKDLTSTWPKLFGEVLFFKPYYGYLVLMIAAIISLILRPKLKENPAWWVILGSLLIQVFLLPLYQGPRLPVYMLVFHPYIILLTGWVVWRLKRWGYLILGVLLALSSVSNLDIVRGHTLRPLVSELKQAVDTKSTTPISLYTRSESEMISYPLFYLLLKEMRISESGYRIGVCDEKFKGGIPVNCPQDLAPFSYRNNYFLYDLSSMREIVNFKRIDSQEIFNSLYSRYR